MKTSIITVCFNSVETIEDTIRSVLGQDYKNIEYVIIDGGSTDGTLDILTKYQGQISKCISEPDNGIYDAMNKGINLATGEVIGFLHADDFYATKETIKKVARVFEQNKVDCLWGDLVYVSKENTEKIIRYWKSGGYRKNLFKNGWMPAHPTFFAKRCIYEKYGYFNTDFRIAADYEIMLRFLHKFNISNYYIPEVLVKMRVGGLSNRSLKNVVRKSIEDYRAWNTNNLSGRIHTIMMKNISKIPQFFTKFKSL
jgi:glycosyltransferase